MKKILALVLALAMLTLCVAFAEDGKVTATGKGQGIDGDVVVEVTADAFSDTISAMESIRKRVAASIKEIVGLSPKITLVAPGSLPRSEGKIKRVIDNRRK